MIIKVAAFTVTQNLYYTKGLNDGAAEDWNVPLDNEENT